MNWNDAVEAAEQGGCDQCQNPERCAAEGACVIELDEEFDHDAA